MQSFRKNYDSGAPSLRTNIPGRRIQYCSINLDDNSTHCALYKRRVIYRREEYWTIGLFFVEFPERPRMTILVTI